MEDIISKELLSEVLKDRILRHDPTFKEIVKIIPDDDRFIQINFRRNDRHIMSYLINIYELTYRCKTWAVSKGFIISTRPYDYFEDNTYSGWYWHITPVGDCHRCPNCGANGTELEAVVKACQWILDKKEI